MSMAYRIGICDDDPTAAQGLRDMVADWAKDTGIPCDIRLFPSAEAFLFAYADEKSYDILLLDVEMSGMDGISLARHLRCDNCRAQIIFISSHFEFVGDGYEVDALHYLTKPVAAQKLHTVLTRAAKRLATEPPSLLISCEGEMRKIYESDILYAESFLHDLVIHTKDGEYRTKGNISAFAERLGAEFYRSHRSYLVNLRSIVRIGRKSVTLENGTEIPIARGKYDDINRAFIAHN